MPIKGSIGSNIYHRNEFAFNVAGIGDLTVISVSEIEQNLQTVTLSDRTVVTGGSTEAFEIDVVTPAGNNAEQAKWQQWYLDSQHPAEPTYKKTVTIVRESAELPLSKTMVYTLEGVFIRKRMDSDFDMDNEGEDARVTWTLSVDDVTVTHTN